MTHKYLFAGGGTGGHIFPGVAVALELQRREPDARMLFVGSEKDLEQSILARHGFQHQSLPVESLQTLRKRPFQFVLRNWRAWRSARLLIRDERPSVVIGLGGYASAPVVWAAARFKIPVVLLEQNVIPGRTTRWLARSADIICATFEETRKRLPTCRRVEITGNPVRSEFSEMATEPQISTLMKPKLLILGGSQGSDLLNEAVLTAVELLHEELSTWQIVHQTGPRQVTTVRAAYQKLSMQTTVEPFFDDVSEHYQTASIAIARAGGTTLAELTCSGLPMVLLPYPYSADNHQQANAKYLQDHGAAMIVEHQPIATETAKRLASQLRLLLSNADRREAMSSSARLLATPQASSTVANLIQSRIAD